MNIYVIYDRLAELYGNPFVLDERIAERTFRYMTKERKEADCEDKEIHCIGQYDEATGTVTDRAHTIAWDIGKEKEKLNG